MRRTEGPDGGSVPVAIDRAAWSVGAVVVLGSMLSTIDGTIVNVAVDELGRVFDAPIATIQWVTTGYLLAVALVIPLTGWSSERFGARRMWLITIAAFLLGSLLCSVAWSPASLIAFRVLQGLAGGMILPIGQTLLVRAAGPARLGRVMSVVGIPWMLAPVLGPVLGGLIVDGLGWRWIFLMNIPIGIVAMALSLRVLPADRPVPRHRLDRHGLLLLAPAAVLLVYAPSAGVSDGLGRGAIACGVAGAAMLVLFIAYARRQQERALIPPSLFARRSVRSAATLSAIFGATSWGALFLIPLFFQVVRGDSALAAGLMMAPQGLGAALALPLSGRAVDRRGPRNVVLAGIALTVIGTLPFVVRTAATSDVMLLVALFVRGVGIGASSMPSQAAAYLLLERRQISDATTAIGIIGRLGATLGTTAVALVVQQVLNAGHEPAKAFALAFALLAALGVIAAVPAVALPAGRVAVGPGGGAPPTVRPGPAPSHSVTGQEVDGD
jgi:EmrB/QacA subfamily drug resistance transporter